MSKHRSDLKLFFMIRRPDTRGFRRTLGVESGPFVDHAISIRGPQHSDKTFRVWIFTLNLGTCLKIEINKDFHTTLCVTYHKICVVDDGIVSVSFLEFFFCIKNGGFHYTYEKINVYCDLTVIFIANEGKQKNFYFYFDLPTLTALESKAILFEL